MTSEPVQQRVSITMEEGPMNSSDDIFRHHRRLVEWAVLLGGYIHPDVRISHNADSGFHMVVATGKQVRAETRIMSCPMSATISVLNAYDIEPFYSHGTKFPQSFLKNHQSQPELIQTFFLMEQYLNGDDSWWESYIKTLPSMQDVNNMQFTTKEDLAWLEGTNLGSGCDKQASKWKELFARGLRDLKVLEWPNALNGKYTWELYRWAATMYGSRSFTSSVLDDTLPADRVRMSGRAGVPQAHDWLIELFMDKFSVLLPMIDILNHWPVTPVEWQARSTYVGMQILETYESGRELSNNYGPKDNEGLLLSYGFVIPGNLFDHVVIDIKPQPGSPLETALTWQKDERSHPTLKKFLLHPEHPTAQQALCLETSPFSYDLLDAISILFGNDRELQTMFTMEQSLMSYSLGPKKAFDDHRNLLVTLSQLHRECGAQGARLHATYPHGAEPQSYKQKAAQIYRHGQYLLYQVACLVCEYVLFRSGTDWSQEVLIDALKAKFPEDAFVLFQRLLNKHKCITNPGEMLSESGLLEMLPQPVRERLSLIWRKLEVAMTTTYEAEKTAASTAITHAKFSLMLSYGYQEYTHGTKLPSRLTKLLDQLTQWYPPSDPNWSYVPHNGPWSPGEEPPHGLMIFLAARKDLSDAVESALKPEMLCWGWNVIDEEKVLIAADLARLMEPKMSLDGDVAVALRLYCKQ